MNRIKIPKFFKSKLKGHDLEGPLIQSVQNFSDFIGDSTRQLTFFPEFTDHGLQHFQYVLDATEWLIAKPFRRKVTPDDVAILVLSVFLHDLAMHLTEDGFLTLIQSKHFHNIVPEIDNKSWRDLWDNYIAEVSRWGEREINTLLGPIESSDFKKCFEILLDLIDKMPSPDIWPRACYKITGEFIRRNHGRMAHEFAIAGIPGPSNIKLFQPIQGLDNLRDMCGLIGRSHTMEMRQSFPYLKNKYHGRVTCLNTHPVFLMALLRIADYLHIEASRAPHVSLAVRSIRSPFSRGEWDMHQSISDVRQDEEDEEAIFVVTNPSNNKTFLRVQRLLNDLQRELDNSWAAIGEVYSRTELKNARLRLRRVRSNIDDMQNFQNSVDYLPRKFSFETAGANLLNRLVGGLYGESPEVGIRELLQNSIDAVRELKFLASKQQNAENWLPRDKTNIIINLEGTDQKGGYLEITDYGIGMDQDVLSNYFLRAGASFRDSEIWQKNFLDKGIAKVTRSGRFGIGVLAAFLLGKRIQVTTRHFLAKENEALTFCAAIEDELIEIKKTTRKYPGTTIHIQINANTFAKLNQNDGLEWDWYRWKEPTVERIINGRKDLPKLTQIPGSDNSLPEEWHSINVDGYEKVLWTYGRAPHLVCNGLNIGTCASAIGYHVCMHWEGFPGPMDFYLPLGVPYVSVVDKNGILPIDLQRFSLLNHKYPFADQLLEDVTKDYIAFCFVFGPTSPSFMDQLHKSKSLKGCPGYIKWIGPFTPTTLIDWIFTKDGAAPINYANLKNLSLKKLIVLIMLNRSYRLPDIDHSDNGTMLIGCSNDIPAQYIDLREILLSLLRKSYKNGMDPKRIFDENTGAVVLGQRDILDNILVNLNQMQSIPANVVGIEEENDTLSVFNYDYDKFDIKNISTEIKQAIADGNIIYAEILQPRMTLEHPENAFDKTWWDIMPESIIPYNETKRNELLSKIISKIKDHVEKWQNLKEMGMEEIRRRFKRKTDHFERL